MKDYLPLFTLGIGVITGMAFGFELGYERYKPAITGTPGLISFPDTSHLQDKHYKGQWTVKKPKITRSQKELDILKTYKNVIEVPLTQEDGPKNF